MKGHDQVVTRLSRSRALLFLWLWLAMAGGLRAQDAGPIEDDRVTPASVQQARAAISERVAAVEAVHKATSSSVERERLGRVLAILRETDLYWQQIQASLELRDALTVELESLQDPVESDPVGDQGYSFRAFERLLSELEAEKAKGITLQAALAAAEENLRDAKGRADDAAKARRAAREAANTNQNPEKAAGLAGALELALAEVERVNALVTLRQLELQCQRLTGKVHEKRLESLSERVERVRGAVRFRNDDLREVLGEIEEREFEVGRELERAKVNLDYVQSRWFAARQQLESDGEGDPTLAAEVEAKRLARQARQSQVRNLTKELERLARMKQIWERRYQIARGAASDEQREVWEAESLEGVRQLERDARLPEARLLELREDLATVGRRITDLGEQTGSLARWLEQQRREVDFAIGVWQRDRAVTNEVMGLEQKLLAEMGTRTLSVWDRVRWAWDRVAAVWGFELTSVEDRPITVGKIVSGLVLLVLGVWLSRVIRRAGHPAGAGAGGPERQRDRGDPDRGVLRIGPDVYAVRAAFDQRPAGRVHRFGRGGGDRRRVRQSERDEQLHQRADPAGRTTHQDQGPRAGRRPVRDHRADRGAQHPGPPPRRTSTSSFPTAPFLEQNVINWTLTDNQVRTSVSVGVAYGSDVELVTNLLLRAAKEHGKVLDRPETPIILFKDFGDNALVFELHFWTPHVQPNGTPEDRERRAVSDR